VHCREVRVAARWWRSWVLSLAEFAARKVKVAIPVDGLASTDPNLKGDMHAPVTKLSASSGAVVGTYPVGSGPVGVAFDGSNIWVTNGGSTTVTQIPVN